jgi:hypothetical protein
LFCLQSLGLELLLSNFLILLKVLLESLLLLAGCLLRELLIIAIDLNFWKNVYLLRFGLDFSDGFNIFRVVGLWFEDGSLSVSLTSGVKLEVELFAFTGCSLKFVFIRGELFGFRCLFEEILVVFGGLAAVAVTVPTHVLIFTIIVRGVHGWIATTLFLL